MLFVRLRSTCHPALNELYLFLPAAVSATASATASAATSAAAIAAAAILIRTRGNVIIFRSSNPKATANCSASLGLLNDVEEITCTTADSVTHFKGDVTRGDSNGI